MRVIAGSAKKMTLALPKNWTGRPTSDRVKEALFNIWGERVENKIFLDIFAGTGNIGLEALSRGAKQSFFVEKEASALKTIRQNLVKARLDSKAVLLGGTIPQILHKLELYAERPEVVFLDPPYRQGLSLMVLEELVSFAWLAEQAEICVETDKREELPPQIAKLGKVDLYRKEKYGDTLLWFFQYHRLK